MTINKHANSIVMEFPPLPTLVPIRIRSAMSRNWC